MGELKHDLPSRRCFPRRQAILTACRISLQLLAEHIVRGMCAPSHAIEVFPERISSEHGWSCMQKNAICNVLGGRTNNRPLQPTNGRVISLANAPSNVANN